MVESVLAKVVMIPDDVITAREYSVILSPNHLKFCSTGLNVYLCVLFNRTLVSVFLLKICLIFNY